MAASNQKLPGLSPAGEALGLGGLLADQVKGETDDERKKRMAGMTQPVGTFGQAATMLLGGRGGGLGGI